MGSITMNDTPRVGLLCPAVQFENPLANAEPEAVATGLPRPRPVDAIKRLEQIGKLSGRDARTVVADHYFNGRARSLCSNKGRIHLRRPTFSTSFFACHTAADHTFRFAGKPDGTANALSTRKYSFCALWRLPLPNIRHKTMLDFLLVFPITRQIVCKESLFVKEPPYQKWHHKYDGKESPVRTKGNRRANDIQQ